MAAAIAAIRSTGTLSTARLSASMVVVFLGSGAPIGQSSADSTTASAASGHSSSRSDAFDLTRRLGVRQQSY